MKPMWRVCLTWRVSASRVDFDIYCAFTEAHAIEWAEARFPKRKQWRLKEGKRPNVKAMHVSGVQQSPLAWPEGHELTIDAL